MKKFWKIHPFLFGLYPILFLFSQNLDEVVLTDLFLPVTFVMGVTVVLLLLFRLILGSYNKSSILTSIFLILFFSFGHIRPHLNQIGIHFSLLQPLYRHVVWGVILCVIPFLGSAVLVWRSKGSLESIIQIMSVVIVVLTLTCLMPIIQFQMQLSTIPESQNLEWKDDLEKIPLKDDTQLPNIYYLILDGYGGQKSLSDFYGNSNQEFVDELRKRGFFVANSSRSNYGFTMRSLPSSLNMNYVEELYSQYTQGSEMEYSMGRKLIQDNFTVGFLKEQGYKYYHYGSSGFPPTKVNINADKNLSIEKFQEFERMLLDTTALGPAQSILTSVDRRNSILYAFNQLKEVPNEKAPVFSFAHFIIPHPPYVFGQEGESYSFVQLARQEGMKKAEHYVDQMIFINKKLLEFIDTILAKSEEPPVIILQGDHGPRPEWRGLKSFLVDRENPEEFNKYLRETLNIMNAYYVPEKVKKNLYHEITPVNSFRVLFNGLFGTNFKLLEDKTFIVGKEGKLEEVTTQAREAIVT